MKNCHASELRGQARQDARHRQLRALAWGGLLIAATWSALAQAPPRRSAQEQLRAVKATESALFGRIPTSEEAKNLDAAYAGLSARFPQEVAIRNARAEFLANIGARDRALREWLAAEGADSKNSVVLDHLGGAFLASGDVKKSAGYYSRAVENAPMDAGHHFSLANILFLFRHELVDRSQTTAEAVLTRALQQFAEASRLAPLNAEYARAYAETFYSLAEPDWKAAFAAWEHFRVISPQKDFAWANLARVHMKLGRKTEAVTCLQKIQSVDYERIKTRLRQRIDTE